MKWKLRHGIESMQLITCFLSVDYDGSWKSAGHASGQESTVALGKCMALKAAKAALENDLVAVKNALDEIEVTR
jgi:hypothetical protein